MSKDDGGYDEDYPQDVAQGGQIMFGEAGLAGLAMMQQQQVRKGR